MRGNGIMEVTRRYNSLYEGDPHHNLEQNNIVIKNAHIEVDSISEIYDMNISPKRDERPDITIASRVVDKIGVDKILNNPSDLPGTSIPLEHSNDYTVIVENISIEELGPKMPIYTSGDSRPRAFVNPSNRGEEIEIQGKIIGEVGITRDINIELSTGGM